MIDKLYPLIVKQIQLQSLVDRHGYEFKDVTDIVTKYMSWIVGETDECNREVNYKVWKQPKEIDMDKLSKEIADIFIFWLDMVIRLNLHGKIFDVVAEKQNENVQRQIGNISGREDYVAKGVAECIRSSELKSENK